MLASDDKTVIAFMSEGAYFGEIGLLLTQKRSCSVRAKVVSVLFTVEKDDLMQVLEEFPLHLKYLKAVGRQRLKTTHPADLKDHDSEQELTIKFKQEIQSKNQAGRGASLFRLESTPLPENLEESAIDELFVEEEEVKWYQTPEYKHLKHFVILPFSL